jgi:hypothetical protein
MNMARVRALAIIGTLLVAATVLVVVTMNRDTQTEQQVKAKCPAGYVPVDLSLPKPDTVVKINVFNATGTPSLATSVANDFRYRKFEVVKTDNEKTVGNAWILQAYFLLDGDLQFDIKREDDIVDVVLGGQFKQLATPTEFNQAIGAMGHPDLPEGTCPADKPTA